MLDFARANAECERAHRAVRRSVAIAADDGVARLRDSKLGSDHMHDALIAALHVEKIDAVLLAVTRERFELRDGVGIKHRKRAIFRRDRVVHHREGQLGLAHFAAGGFQPGKCLRRSAFVDQMAVDVNQRGFSRLFVDDVRIPDLFVECARGHKLIRPP